GRPPSALVMSFDVRRVPPLLAASGLIFGTSAATAEECNDRFYTDRPGTTDSHATVSPACALVEGGAQSVHEGHSDTNSIPLLLRIGLHRTLVLRAFTDTVRIANRAAEDTGLPEDDTQVEAPSAGLGVKLMAVEARGQLPGLGLVVEVSSITSSDFVDAISARTALLFDWPF